MITARYMRLDASQLVVDRALASGSTTSGALFFAGAIQALKMSGSISPTSAILVRMPQPRKTAGFGWIPDLPDHRDLLYSVSLQTLKELPKSVDLRKKCPAVYDQGRIGSCTANAIAGAIQFDRMKNGEKPDFVP